MVRLQTRQFERAIGQNALRSLPDDTAQIVQKAYVEILRVNQFLERLLNLRAAAIDYTSTDSEMVKTARRLQQALIPDAMVALEVALGKHDGAANS
jgi:hypothetical protein